MIHKIVSLYCDRREPRDLASHSTYSAGESDHREPTCPDFESRWSRVPVTAASRKTARRTEFVGNGSVIRRISSRSFLGEGPPCHVEGRKAEARRPKPVFSSERGSPCSRGSWRSLIVWRRGMIATNTSGKSRASPCVEPSFNSSFDRRHLSSNIVCLQISNWPA